MLSTDMDQSCVAPFPEPYPAGIDLRYSDLWNEIREARRHEEPQDLGVWTREPKEADWKRVFNLCTSALAERSKDLQLAIWRLEAAIRLDGFTGLQSGLALTRELIVQYWALGLHPGPEETGDWELRLGILEWLNVPLARVIGQTVLARHPHTKRAFVYIDYLEALSVGSQRDWCRDEKVDEYKKTRYEKAIADGRTSMESWQEAVGLADKEDLTSIRQSAEGSRRELDIIEKVVCDNTEVGAISLNHGRGAIDDVWKAISSSLAAASPPMPVNKLQISQTSILSAVTPPQTATPSPDHISEIDRPANDYSVLWDRAEDLVRSGSMVEGFAEMARLAASAPSGRDLFLRKLVFAERCLTDAQNLLAVLIFEELDEQIETFRLHQWEPSTLVGRVWKGLYRCYDSDRHTNGDKAAKVFARFCRLNPWEAYAIKDAAQPERTGDSLAEESGTS